MNDFDTQLVQAYAKASKKRLGVQWIADELGVSKIYAQSRSRYLRAHGVKVPRLSSSPGNLDNAKIDALNALLEEDNGRD
jgi:hypothetical protein